MVMEGNMTRSEEHPPLSDPLPVCQQVSYPLGASESSSVKQRVIDLFIQQVIGFY